MGEAMKALVVFCDNNDHPLSRFLKPGYRHVMCVVQTDAGWVRIDGARGIPNVQVEAPGSLDLAAYYRKEGFEVLEVSQGTSANPLPLTLNNCVGMVKAVLGVRSWSITPHQLYRHLRKERSSLKRASLFSRAWLPGFGGGAPAPPDPVTPPPPPPTQVNEGTRRAREDERRRVSSLRGDKSTLLTGGRGVSGGANIGRVTLLGQGG